MNEGVIRSPKWLRNFADFEINTGEDIKGKPSKRMQKKIEEEERRKREEEERRKKEEEERREQKRREEEERNQEEFQKLFNIVSSYIYHNYKDCEISVPRPNYLTVEKHDLQYENRLDFEFEVTLNNDATIPSFETIIILGNKKYTYTASGLSFIKLKRIFVEIIYPWYTYTQKSSYYGKSKRRTSYEQEKPNENEEVKKKRKLYKLLKDTLDGYNRQMDQIKEWKRKNPGETHSDEETVKNEIKAVKNKINLLNNKYQFESKHYLIHLKPFFS